MKNFGGDVLFLDRADINTDEILPAKYAELSKDDIGPYLFEGLTIQGFNPKSDVTGKRVLITRENFGCGNESEYAPWALEENGIFTVIAPSFAKSFKEHMASCGVFAIEIDKKSMADIFRTFADKDAECKIVLNDDGTAKAKLYAGSLSKSYPFELTDAEKKVLGNDAWKGFKESKF